jgi:hypothetical protein
VGGERGAGSNGDREKGVPARLGSTCVRIAPEIKYRTLIVGRQHADTARSAKHWREKDG